MLLPRKSVLCIALSAWCLAVVAAHAAIPARVVDEGDFFSSAAIDRANEKVKEIDRDFHRTLLIETISSVPADQQAKLKQQTKEKFFLEWSEKRAQQAGVKGIYILICKEPAHIQVAIDKATQAKAFTFDDRRRLLLKVMPWMKQKKYDEALREMVDFVQVTLRTTSSTARSGAVAARPAAPKPLPRPSAPLAKALPGAQGSLLTWIVIGLIAFVGLWIVLAIFRAIFRAMSGGGGGGYGSAGAPGGFGGGGGGFMTSLLGGIFGAAAGNWLYDSFFRGGHSGGWMDTQAYGSPASGDAGAPGEEPGAGDFSGDPGGGGADFGDDAGAGDFGGGDFGGGFDSGGGDFGGGGGDF